MDSTEGRSKAIGARIREVRLSRKMSQQALGQAAEVSLPHISLIELGKARMHLDTFIRIAEALQVSTDVLIRPDVPEVNRLFQSEFGDLIGDCSPAEIEAIFHIVRELKAVMHQNKQE